MANAQVCKTCIRGFDPRPVLQILSGNQEEPPLKCGGHAFTSLNHRSDLRSGHAQSARDRERVSSATPRRAPRPPGASGGECGRHSPAAQFALRRIGIPFQPRNALFKRWRNRVLISKLLRAAQSVNMASPSEDHLQGSQLFSARALKYFASAPMLSKSLFARQITSSETSVMVCPKMKQSRINSGPALLQLCSFQ